MIEPYPNSDDDPIMCQMCGTWQPRYAPHNVCCAGCNQALRDDLERAIRDRRGVEG